MYTTEILQKSRIKAELRTQHTEYFLLVDFVPCAGFAKVLADLVRGLPLVVDVEGI